MVNRIYEELKNRMEKSLKALVRDFSRIRTGRASPALLEGVRVDYYGVPTPLNQMATISVPESRLITIQPWDVNMISEIERAILKSELGLTPLNDGKIIRISIPPLTEERRKELTKVAKKIAEEYKVGIRSARRDANETLKRLKKNKEISEDEFYKSQDHVQKITNHYIEKVDVIYKEKEREILEF
ncbi:MAG TPA: ribosome recycling factor [Syntrophaceae bacterium]|nr:ribosome recycling factor [Syntrophaceae bacterium]